MNKRGVATRCATGAYGSRSAKRFLNLTTTEGERAFVLGVGVDHESNNSHARWRSALIEAVVFDLDGVLIDSEKLWATAREAFVREKGGRWHPGAAKAMMGMSSVEWSRYLHEELGVPLSPERISEEVAARMEALYRERLPVVTGAPAAVARLAQRWPLGLASSANRPLIDLALEASRLSRYFKATVSSEEVARGKPAPDVYLEAARRLSVDPSTCAAVEDSANGIRSAKAAGMRVVAIPNRNFPPDEVSLGQADVTISALDDLTPQRIDPDAAVSERAGS